MNCFVTEPISKTESAVTGVLSSRFGEARVSRHHKSAVVNDRERYARHVQVAQDAAQGGVERIRSRSRRGSEEKSEDPRAWSASPRTHAAASQRSPSTS